MWPNSSDIDLTATTDSHCRLFVHSPILLSFSMHVVCALHCTVLNLYVVQESSKRIARTLQVFFTSGRTVLAVHSRQQIV